MPLAAPGKPARVRETQGERRARSEGRIINAALKVIAARGVARMTLAEVGERAGYSRSLPAHLFGSKGHLLCECVRRMNADHWMAGLPEPGPAAGLDDLAVAVRRWIHELQTRTAFSRAYYALVQEANCEDADAHWPELSATVRAMVLGGQRRYAAYIQAAIDRGDAAPGLNAEREALMIHAALRGVGLQWLIRPDSVDLAAFRDRVLAGVDRLRRAA
jgi:AcrR family transcriptional regulator